MLSNFTAELHHANLSKINLCDNIINPFNHQKYVAATLQKYVAATQQKYVAATLQKICCSNPTEICCSNPTENLEFFALFLTNKSANCFVTSFSIF